MRNAHFAEICGEKCGNKRNVRQSYVRIKLTFLIEVSHKQWVAIFSLEL